MAMGGAGKQQGVGKRASQACKRCHDQKIKCDGSHPCSQCAKRGQICKFRDVRQRQTAAGERITHRNTRPASYVHDTGKNARPLDHDSGRGFTQLRNPDDRLESSEESLRLVAQRMPNSSHRHASPEMPLTNPLVSHSFNYMFNSKNKPVWMTTASNWAFGKRVLSLVYESLVGRPLPPDNLHFPDETYDLGWNGTRTGSVHADFDVTALPSPDFALHLISAVKFRCCQMLFLFEEETFMKQFTIFHENASTASTASTASQPTHLWYIHYLTILALGKAFQVQTSKVQRPPGAEIIVHAMKLFPSLTFFDADPTQLIPVLCCIALYLQGLDYRASAYLMIGEALRIALLHGMHTGMRTLAIDSTTAQRYSRIWWTVYILERWITSFMGLPTSIADETISAPFPVTTEVNQQTLITEIQIKLYRILAQVIQTVYGAEGRLDKRFLKTTKTALKSIAEVTDQLHNHFGILRSDAINGISRTSAHLHLLHHQCILMTTRPLLYSCLQSKLGQSDETLTRLLLSSSIRALLQMCIDSAQKMLTILSTLSDQGLLETFLPYDLEATFTSSIALSIVAAINHSLLEDHARWSQRAFDIFDEISFRGNKISKVVKSELQQLEELLQLRSTREEVISPTLDSAGQPALRGHIQNPLRSCDTSQQPLEIPLQRHGVSAGEDFTFHEGFTTAQLMDVANAVDIDSLDWFSTSGLDFT